MNEKAIKNITLFDFDGTITRKDSMMAVIIYQRGRIGLLWALIRQLKYIIMMFTGKCSNQLTKERLLNYCFGRKSQAELEAFFTDFARKHADIVRPEMLSELNRISNDAGQMAVVITASPRMWVEKFLPEGTRVLGTELEFDANGFTGHFSTPNCWGPEKVNRLLRELPWIGEKRKEIHIKAYGDSRGDREMFAYADEFVKL